MKKNCWEVKNCGREPNGANSIELGICPAASESQLDGTHGGKNGGRTCWVIAGTLCGGKVQGIFAASNKTLLNVIFISPFMTKREIISSFQGNYLSSSIK